MDIKELEKEIINNLITRKIQNEQEFIEEFLSPIYEKNSVGDMFICFEDHHLATRKYLSFIGVLKFLEQRSLILLQPIHSKEKNITIKNKGSGTIIDQQFMEIRDRYKDLAIIAFPSLESFKRNGYQSESELSLSNQMNELHSSEIRYSEEKRFRTIAQWVSIGLALLSILTSLLTVLLPEKGLEITNLDKVFEKIDSRRNGLISIDSITISHIGDSLYIIKKCK